MALSQKIKYIDHAKNLNISHAKVFIKFATRSSDSFQSACMCVSVSKLGFFAHVLFAY